MNAKWVIWDWNGTLLDDTTAALNAFNAQLVARGLSPISLAFYRDHFAFPVKPFYELCGIDLSREDWPTLAREYHRAYAAQPKTLNDETIAALEIVRSQGRKQAILSALRQDLLEAAVDEYALAGYFDFVYGVDNLDGESKLERAKALLERLGTNDAVLIGDAIHDACVAKELGIPCVLVATGGHSAERLRAYAPTAESLIGALEL